MSGTFDNKGQLVIADGRIISCFGKKKSGKSIMGLLLFRSYPGDRIVIDVAGDDGPMGPDVIELKGDVSELPKRWPEHRREDNKRMTLRYVPDPGSPTKMEDMDAIVGLAMSHGNCALLVHEVGRLAPAGRTPPHTARLLDQNRHRGVTAIFCGPRPKTIDSLVISQSDVLYLFDIRVTQDRERVAQDIGWPVNEITEALEDLGPHEYLRYDDNQPRPATEDEPDLRLVHFPALPEDVAKQTKQWAQGGR